MQDAFEPACECGHVEDQHEDDRHKCLVNECPCVMFAVQPRRDVPSLDVMDARRRLAMKRFEERTDLILEELKLLRQLETAVWEDEYTDIQRALGALDRLRTRSSLDQ